MQTSEMVFDYDNEGYYKGETLCFNGVMPYKATRVLPPPLPWVNTWPRFDEAGQVWQMVEDYRERTPSRGFLASEYQQAGVPYWLPGDKDPSGRYMENPGPFPPNALMRFTPPEKTKFEKLRDLKDEYRMEFNALSLAYQGATIRNASGDMEEIRLRYNDLQRQMAVEIAEVESEE